MFGWEFPPHISGGLGTACYGITKALSGYRDVELTFVVPKTWGDEPVGRTKILGASEVNLAKSKIRAERFNAPFTYLSVQSKMVPYVNPEEYKNKIETECSETIQERNEGVENVKFTGKYNPDLMTEIHNFSVVAEYLAAQGSYDIIHAHDWLTFPAAILAKKATGKPLVAHVHATDFDRSGGKANPDVYQIEKAGMEAADQIITVSDHTRNIVCEKYGIDASKITTVYNGVDPFASLRFSKNGNHRRKRVVFLGRITIQKGPQYFVDVAREVLRRHNDVEFVMAGSGDLLQPMIECAKAYHIADHFIFPGFVKGNQVSDLLRQADVFIMPSVSEPFGIVPLEAMLCRVPVIISKQSGVAEVVKHAIILDYWDTHAMADAVFSILKRPVLKRMLKSKGAAEVKKIRWEVTAAKIVNIYDQFLRA